jgi:hypothetical protein
MDANAIRTAFREYANLIEELWIEADCCKTLLLHHGLLTSEQLDDTLATAKADPAVKKWAAEKFAQTRKALDTLGVQASLEALASSPPPKGKQH